MGLTRSEAATATTREQLLDAAEACFDHGPAARVTVAQVARTAGFSRALIYRHFANRRQLGTDVALRRARRHLHQAADLIRTQESVADGIVDGIIFLSRQAPLGGRADDAEQEALVRQAANELWIPLLTDAVHHGDLRKDLDIAGTALSLALMGFLTADFDRHREMLTQFLVPALVGPGLSVGA